MLVSFSSQGPLQRHWHAVARSEDVGSDEPVGVELLREEVVLWRGPGGRVIAAPDRCTHRKANLSLGHVEDGRLMCSLHGWTFGEGARCVRIPMRDVIVEANHLTAFACEERHGLVWVCRGTPSGEIPTVAIRDDPAFRRTNGSPAKWAAPAPRIVEALLDAGFDGGGEPGFDIPFTYRRPVPTGDGSEALLLVTCSPIGAGTSFVFPVLWTNGTTPGEALLDAEVGAISALKSTVEAVPGMFEIDENAPDDTDSSAAAWRRALLDAVTSDKAPL